MTRTTSTRATVKGYWKHEPALLCNFSPLKKVETPLMAVGALTGGPKVKSRKKKHEVTPTKEATLQTVSYQTRGRSSGKLGKDLTPNQGSPKNTLESASRRTRTRQTREPCLASTPVHSSYTDRVPKILESPVEVKQETKQSVEGLTPVKVCDHIVQVILFLLDLYQKCYYLTPMLSWLSLCRDQRMDHNARGQQQKSDVKWSVINSRDKLQKGRQERKQRLAVKPAVCQRNAVEAGRERSVQRPLLSSHWSVLDQGLAWAALRRQSKVVCLSHTHTPHNKHGASTI